jgi:transposase
MLTYYHLWKMNPTEARRFLVKDYEETKSYSQTARNFATHRRIVRKWVLRYQEEGEIGLESFSPIPKSQPTRLDPQLERLILHLRDASDFGPKRLHFWLVRNLKIEIAISTIAKYLHKHGQTKKHLKRGTAKSFDWKSLPLFSALQVDTKEILDSKVFTQEEKWLYQHLGLPLYQFTAIFPRTRARFISFSFQNTKRASLNFLEYVFSHLESHGAPLEETIYLQTDWGAEYGGHQTRSVKQFDQDLHQLIKLESTSLFIHLHIRKGRSEDNGFVERSHRTDDEEFYRLEKRDFRDLRDFMLKASE